MQQPWQKKHWHQDDPHLIQYTQAAYKRPSLPFDSTLGIHTMLGPRRVGKTTQFKLWIKEALKKYPPEKIWYLDAERFENWKELLPFLEDIQEGLVFLDEITAVEDWPRALKILVDEGCWKNVCAWLTGSNAFDLSNLGERLPGRRGQKLKIRDLKILPLTFKEFHAAITPHFNITPHKSFELYCQWGGYPMSVSECLKRKEPSHDLLQELLDVALGATSRKHRSPRLSAALAERLWTLLGSRVSFNALAKFMDAGSHPIISQYIEVLEACYSLIQTERLNTKTGRGVLRKEKKFYFWDPLTMAALVSWSQTGSVQPSWIRENWPIITKQGGWIENMAAVELKKHGVLPFYDEQHGGEIDFVFRQKVSDPWTAIEIKRRAPSKIELKPLSAYKNSQVWLMDDSKDLSPPFYSIAERLLSLSF